MSPPAAPRPRLDGLGAGRLRDGPWRIIVTGGGGWIGLATLELLADLLGSSFAERLAVFGAGDRLLRLHDGRAIRQRSLADLGELAPGPSLVLHLAYLTQEKAKTLGDDAYAAINLEISSQVLDALDRIGARGLFLPSSGAVYLADTPDAEPSKRLYGRLKREDEARFSRWAARTGNRGVVARVFNLSGPYIPRDGGYALADFIADALAGGPIRIAAARPVWRSYVAIAELMSVVLGLLTGDLDAEPFDSAGEAVYEMNDLAVAVAAALGREPRISRPTLRDGPGDHYVGDGEAYRRLRRLNEVKAVPMATQIVQTASSMADVGTAAWAPGERR